MFIAKGLLIKGLGGLGALAGSGALVFGIHKIFSNSDNTEINKKITEILKLPESCKFTGDESNNTKECDISEEQLKKIEFKDKDGDLTLEGTPANLKLSIKKLEESDKKQYGDGITVGDPWFTFKTESITADIKVKKSDGTAIASLIKGANPEFKINSENKLEKAWTVTTLGEKVNLKCPSNGGSEKKCTVEANKEISYKEGDEIKKLTLNTQNSDKITYTEDQQDYNQGFKFTVASDGISGTNSTTLAAGDYEIKYEAGDNKGWHLAKKTAG